jgi:hypothetical protein
MFIAPLAFIATLTAGSKDIAYTSTSPIQVASCSVATGSGPANFPGIATAYGELLAISFVNHNTKTVKSVTFSVNGAPIVDAGTFSTGVTISHQFVPPQLLAAGKVTCNVQSVAFADGSTWQAQ